jgi:hypothetical protein
MAVDGNSTEVEQDPHADKNPKEWGFLMHGLNAPGFIMFVACAGIVFAFVAVTGLEGKGAQTALFGAAVATMDLTYRIMSAGSRWIQYKVGGIFLFIPVYALGFFWILLGLFKVFARID